MGGIQRGKMSTGQREEAIKKSLSTGAKTVSELVAQGHPRSSVYYTLNRLARKSEGRYIETERKDKKVKAFQLFSKRAPSKEVMSLIEQISNADSPLIRRETAKDLHELASKFPIFPNEAVNFLARNWNDSRYGRDTKLANIFLRTLWIVAAYAKENRLESVIKQIKQTADPLQKVVENLTADPDLRENAWQLLSCIDNARITNIAFKILENLQEKEPILGLARMQIEDYANENPQNAKKKLYEILGRVETGTEVQQRVLNLLGRIRFPMPIQK